MMMAHARRVVYNLPRRILRRKTPCTFVKLVCGVRIRAWRSARHKRKSCWVQIATNIEIDALCHRQRPNSALLLIVRVVKEIIRTRPEAKLILERFLASNIDFLCRSLIVDICGLQSILRAWARVIAKAKATASFMLTATLITTTGLLRRFPFCATLLFFCFLNAPIYTFLLTKNTLILPTWAWRLLLCICSPLLAPWRWCSQRSRHLNPRCNLFFFFDWALLIHGVDWYCGRLLILLGIKQKFPLAFRQLWGL